MYIQDLPKEQQAFAMHQWQLAMKRKIVRDFLTRFLVLCAMCFLLGAITTLSIS